MKKLKLLLMSGFVVLSGAAQNVLAQQNSSSPPSSQTQKPPFATSPSGFFSYGVKTPRGENLRMEVTWEVSKSQPSKESVRISGAVKYKNATTGKLESLQIDENKSYIDHSARLYFALPTISERVFGPVELSAVESARRKKADETAKEGAPDPVKSDLATADDNKPSKVSEPNKPAAPSAAQADEASLDNPSNADLQSSERESLSSANNGSKPNDIFKTAGEFTVGRSVVIKWRQSAFIKGNYYPPGSKAVSFDLYKDGKYQTGWEHKWPSYIDKNTGYVHIKTRAPKGGSKNFTSTKSFHSVGFATLLDAINQIKKEENHLRNTNNLKSLPNTMKNKNGEVVMTAGGLILGGLIQSIGHHNVAHAHKKKDSALAMSTFDNVHRLLQQKKMGFMVHRVAIHSGLKVDHHQTRGRSLVQGETSAAGEARGQQRNIDAVVDNTPPAPWRRDVANLVMRVGFDLQPRNWQQVEVRIAMQNRLNVQATRNAYANDIADYLNRQDILFVNDNDRLLRFWIHRYLTVANNLRNADFNGLDAAQRAYRDTRRNFITYLRDVNDLRITPDAFMNLLDRIPGFQHNLEGLRGAANEELYQAIRCREALALLQRRGFVPPHLLEHILYFMTTITALGV
jgi:hypothetical protein